MMKKYFYVLIFFWSILSVYSINAGTNKQRMFHAYLTGDMGYWKSQIDSLRSADHLSREESMSLLLYEYEYIGYLLGKKMTKEAGIYYPGAQDRLNRLIKEGRTAELESLMSAFIGYEIGLSPYKAPFMGNKCFVYAEKSMQMAPDEPWGFLQLANVKYYAPAVFGGSKDESLKLFYEAKDRFHKRITIQTPWRYASLLRAIAQNYEALGEYDKALQCYNSILKQYPNYKWVAEVLRPGLLKKMNKH
ncbi:MAG: tetratricopeptide repeat protein [Bacteroidales bacterium]